MYAFRSAFLFCTAGSQKSFASFARITTVVPSATAFRYASIASLFVEYKSKLALEAEEREPTKLTTLKPRPIQLESYCWATPPNVAVKEAELPSANPDEVPVSTSEEQVKAGFELGFGEGFDVGCGVGLILGCEVG